jgi:uncharacterized protein YndB with AHSA1/START domain
MPDIVHQFPIEAPVARVFDAVSTPTGLDAWWTLRCAGTPGLDATYELYFGPEYDWRAVVSRFVNHREFELDIIEASPDWIGTRVGFVLTEKDGVTTVRFHHNGWTEKSEHFCISSFCWASYLRLLRRYVEQGEIVAYAERDDA